MIEPLLYSLCGLQPARAFQYQEPDDGEKMRRVLLPIVLVGVAVLVVMDVVGALTDRPLGFPYPRLGVVSLLVYFAVGALSAWRGTFNDGLAAAILVGLLDGTLGPLAAWMVGPGPLDQTVAEPGIFAYQIAVVTGTATALGLIGALASNWLERRRVIRSVVPR
jgi:hypothetical protein